ncbi:MAG: hypothetical protein ACI835_002839 [Planctomycetota bacterium]|jgi:hypothetical protein
MGGAPADYLARDRLEDLADLIAKNMSAATSSGASISQATRLLDDSADPVTMRTVAGAAAKC